MGYTTEDVTEYVMEYHSPLGEILIAGQKEAVTGLWFKGQKYYASTLKTEYETRNLPVLEEAASWLDGYFSGQLKEMTVPVAPAGSRFRQDVWEILCGIPYGEVITYGKIAARMAEKMGRRTMSAQAVGGAVGHNPGSILIPCHRVVGADGSLTGYAGGLDRKKWLLELEKKHA